MSDTAGEWLPGLSHPEEIGRGGFGVVYRAWEPELDRWVAVKLLTEVDDRSERRFERERRAIGALGGHPHITSVFRWGSRDDGRPYLVMEFLSGGSLEDRLERSGPMGWEEVAELGVKIASALETAHRAGVFHRDVKPGNLLLSEHGVPLLCDFGIARMSDGYQTKSGVLTASVHHAPPEVFDGSEFTAPSDVYSLGSTLAALLLGSPPFARDTDETILSVIARVANDPPPDLTLNGAPRPIADVIATSMAKNPADRYQSAAEFGRALQVAQRESGVEPTPLIVSGMPPLPPPAGAPAEVIAAAPAASAETITSAAAAATPASDEGGTATVVVDPAKMNGDGSDGNGGKKVWIAVAAVVVVVILGAAAVLLLGGSDDGGEGGDVASETTDAPSTTDKPETTDTGDGTVPEDMIDLARLKSDMEADYMAQVGLTLDLTCPDQVERKKDNNFDCTGPDGQGDIITVTVTQTDDEGHVSYEVTNCEGDTCMTEE